jgi:hypothetical protein
MELYSLISLQRARRPPMPPTLLFLIVVYLLENPGIPLLFRIQTNSLKVLDLKFKVLDEII